ncbi:MAG TPA: hypothetical protein VEP90_18300, partial [Methylomirabilota bacterium]|nr:hypothetical protein [Methylomirabilota bacterium]
ETQTRQETEPSSSQLCSSTVQCQASSWLIAFTTEQLLPSSLKQTQPIVSPSSPQHEHIGS